jgi:iron transport multicopper oxidase
MSWFWITGALTLALNAAGHGAKVVHEWTVGNANIAPDGYTRSAALVNGVFPGPLLTANKGDHISVKLHNDLQDSTMRRSTSIVYFSVPKKYKTVFNA